MSLTFEQVQNNGGLPANSIVLINNKPHIDIGALMGENLTALNVAKVVEFSIKWLMACNKAQDVYNATALVGQRLGSFPAPISGSNQYYSNVSPAGMYASMQCNVTGLIPADIHNAIAVFQ